MIKTRNFLLPILLFVLFLGLPSPVLAQTDPPPTIQGDKVVVGQTFILKEDQTLNGDLVVIGGTAILKTNANVSGDVVLIGGVMDVFGKVNGDVTSLGGSLNLMNTAIISGSLINFGSTIAQQEGATIQGQQIANLPFSFNFNEAPFVEQVPVPNLSVQRVGGFIGTLLWAIVQVLAVAALAILVFLLFPKPTERVSSALANQPFVNWGIGLLTAFAAPIAFVVMIITIILIPLGLIGFLVLGFALLFGWISLGYEIGRRLLKGSTTELSPALVAGLGTLILTAVARLAAVIPCVGWTVGAVLALFGLGAVVLTRAGTRNYPPVVEALYYPAPPPTQPARSAMVTEPKLADLLADEEEIDPELDDEFDNDDLPFETNENKNKPSEE
jgi:hypothetical protein